MGSVTHFKDLNGYKCFVETGTSNGASANYLSNLCERGYTIDILDQWSPKKDNVEFLLGTSEYWLEKICPEIEEDCIFWLDAHYPRDYGFMQEVTNIPLIKELEIIAKYRQNKKDLILMDDLRIYVDDNYQSGILPSSHEHGDENFLCYVEELFPGRKLKIDLEDEGYLSIIC